MLTRASERAILATIVALKLRKRALSLYEAFEALGVIVERRGPSVRESGARARAYNFAIENLFPSRAISHERDARDCIAISPCHFISCRSLADLKIPLMAPLPCARARGGRCFPRSRRILRVCPEVRVNGALTRAILWRLSRVRCPLCGSLRARERFRTRRLGTREHTLYPTRTRIQRYAADNEKEKRARARARVPCTSQDRLSAIEDDEGGAARHSWPTRGGNKTARLGVGEPAISGYRACSLRLYYWPCNYC